MNQKEFIEEVKKIGIEIDEIKLQQLETYYTMLIEKNKVMNLTRITEKEDVYLKHFYDSLTIVKVIDLNKEYTLCDIGTGAGFPGIVLKIVFPNLKITLVDSLLKRINFLNEVINQLELKDIVAVHSRIEDYGKESNKKYDIVTARAVKNLNDLLSLAIPLVKSNGYFIPMKANVDEELKESETKLKKLNCKLIKKEEFYLVKENSIRNLLLIQNNGR